jgi:hypothetical protein
LLRHQLSGRGTGSEFFAKEVRACIEAVDAKVAFIEPGSPWENGPQADRSW